MTRPSLAGQSRTPYVYMTTTRFRLCGCRCQAQWRNLRKICREQLFALQRLDAGQGLRRKKVQELLDYVHESCKKGQAVDIGRAAFTTSLNLLSNTIFSIDMAHYRSSSSQEFKELVWAVMEQGGKPNLADYFPFLKLIDLQGIRRKQKILFGKLSSMFDKIVNQRLQSRASSETSTPLMINNDVLEALLNICNGSDIKLNVKDIKHLFLRNIVICMCVLDMEALKGKAV
ncbi:hypothetical protein F0562_014802 [Nyssa sinensis]|uniref:Geraniol 8-hydroxylase n=1 Tax=Nyssa sinensis TaxID=561372 RepID=A0A5J4ZS10_9ASTE|nr:hypothetical protein F0562_014802 [Nyssa sinensis]